MVILGHRPVAQHLVAPMGVRHDRLPHLRLSPPHTTLGFQGAHTPTQLSIHQPPAGGHRPTAGQNRCILDHHRGATGTPNHHLEVSLRLAPQERRHSSLISEARGIGSLGSLGSLDPIDGWRRHDVVGGVLRRPK